MKKNNRILFIGAFVVIGAGAYMVYKFVSKNKPKSIISNESNESNESGSGGSGGSDTTKSSGLSKQDAVNIIVNSGKHSNASTISSFDLSFLRAWANAVVNKKDTFSYNGKNYKTQGGTSLGSLSLSALGNAYFPLKKGSTGVQVATLQKWLNDKGYANPKLVADGVFGAKTESAIKLMQDTPYEKAISDYINDAIWGTNYSSGQVSKEFYDKFVK